MAIVGLPDKAVSEAGERVRSALIASGLALPARRITVTLAPADLPKEGSHYDLPIALGLMAAIGAIPPDALAGFTVLGELGLDGSIAPVAGVLPAAIGANARDEGLICPAACGAEAAWASPDIQIVAATSLIQIANHFKGTQVLSRPLPRVREAETNLLDLRDIKGQESAKRALEIAAAGGHHLLMIGSPGAGKSMLAAPMNPCRSGHAYEPGYSCRRGRVDRCAGDYQARISGPLMDRIDLRIEVPAVTAADLILPPPTEGSAEVAARVAAARDVQMARYAAAGLPHVRTNAEAPASVLEEIAQPDTQGLKMLRDAAETMRLSARGYHRVLRVARTLAHLDGAEKIGRLHLAEALSYRALAEDLRRAA